MSQLWQDQLPAAQGGAGKGGEKPWLPLPPQTPRKNLENSFWGENRDAVNSWLDKEPMCGHAQLSGLITGTTVCRRKLFWGET